MPKIDWITYTRERRGFVRAITQHVSEPQPFGYGWVRRPATPEERDEEIRRRSKSRNETIVRVLSPGKWVTFERSNGAVTPHASRTAPKPSPLKRIAPRRGNSL